MRSFACHLSACLLVIGLAGCQKARRVTVAAPRVPAPPGEVALVAEAEVAAPAEPAAEQKPPAAAKYAERTRQFLEAADKGRVSLLMELLTQGADVNDKDDDGSTALHNAVAKGHRSAVIALLVRGADLAEKDGKGRTPLMVAAEAGHADVLSLLLTPDSVQQLAGDVLKGVAPEALKSALPGLSNRLQLQRTSALEQTDQGGQTALMKAAANGHADCVKALASAANSLGAGSLLRRDRQGRNALMLAVAAGHPDAVEAFLQAGSQLKVDDLRQTDKAGTTALQMAEAGGNKNVAQVLRRELATRAAVEGDVATLKEMLEVAPADVPAQRAIYTAASQGSVPVVQLLMEKWKDRPVADKLRLMGVPSADNSGTALHIAARHGREPVVQALLDNNWWKDKAVQRDFINHLANGTTGSTAGAWAGFYQHAKTVEILNNKVKELEGGK